MAYRVEVDRDVCMSSGTCVADLPAFFRFDDDELAEVVPGAPPPSDSAQLALARACPSGALRVFDGDEELDLL